MKPSEMSNDELANWLVPFQNVDGSGAAHYLPEVVDEAAARLRNSIPKPVVEVKSNPDNSVYMVRVDGMSIHGTRDLRAAWDMAKVLRTALGINDTEGGE